MSELTKTKSASVGEYLRANKDKLEATIPAHVNTDRLMRVAVQAISGSDILARCSMGSLVTSIIRASMLGIEPNGPLAEGYLVPYGTTCQLIIGYRGLINLARRSGYITEIYAHPVHENDEFSYEYGTNPSIIHRPPLGNRGEMIGVYAVYVTKDGTRDFEVMDRQQVDKVRSMSKGGNSPSSPWNNWYEEMARKTVIRRLAKRMPMSVEMAQAVEIDNKTSVGEAVDNRAAVIETTGIEIPEDPNPQAEIDEADDPTRA